jgi:hypothetical protein
LPYQFVDELTEFECKVYSLSTCSDPSHLLSLSLLLLLSLGTWLTPFNLDTLSCCCCCCNTINPAVLALLKCLTFGILLGSVVEKGDFSELQERERERG